MNAVLHVLLLFLENTTRIFCWKLECRFSNVVDGKRQP